jgi:hypothetical protein
LPKRDEEVSGAGASSVVRSFRTGFGTNGVKARPHWRHIELFAAAYSICLKPQCGHSALTFAGDGLATVCLPKPFLYARTPNAALIGSLGAQLQDAVQLLRNGAGGDFGFPDKSCALFNYKTRRFEISLQHAFGFQFAALGNDDIAVHLAVTVIDLVLISPRISAFSPTVKTPSELMSPSTLPSMSSSFWNLIEPLISTSLERMSLPP